MRIEFDPAKDSANVSKHGVSLALATNLDWDAALVWVDLRFDYGEIRITALVPEMDTLYYVSFVERNQTRRFISLRRANRREVNHYVKNA